MAKYVLGENAVRKLRGLLVGTSSVSGASSSRFTAEAREYEAPWMVRWSASAADGGCWVIWLPSGAWVGAVVDESTCQPVSGWPSGWYKLPASVVASSGTSQIYADGSGGTIVFSSSSTDGVHVADVTINANGTNTVKQILRSVIATGAADNGCFKITGFTRSGSQVFATLANLYYLRGGVTTQFAADGTSAYASGILALRVAAYGSTLPALVNYGSFSELVADSSNPAYVVTPLYKFSSGGEVDVDFRNIPHAQLFETL